MKNGYVPETAKCFTEEKRNEKAIYMSSLYDDLPPHYQDVVLGTIELLRKANEIEKLLR